MTLHLTATDDPPRADTALARFFAEMRKLSKDNLNFPVDELQELICQCGLCDVRDATQADLDEHDGWEIDIGDPVLVLTEAGRAAIEATKR